MDDGSPDTGAGWAVVRSIGLTTIAPITIAAAIQVTIASRRRRRAGVAIGHEVDELDPVTIAHGHALLIRRAVAVDRPTRRLSRKTHDRPQVVQCCRSKSLPTTR